MTRDVACRTPRSDHSISTRTVSLEYPVEGRSRLTMVTSLRPWSRPSHRANPAASSASSRWVVSANREELLRNRYWVATRAEEDLFLKHGVRASAIGSPFVYLPTSPERRMPGSLLVMPVHSLAYTTRDCEAEDYANAIASIKESFSDVAVCVYRQCYYKSYWVEAFASRIGTGHEDARCCIIRSRPHGSGPAAEVTWVFMEESGEERFGHHIANGLIGVPSA